LARHNEKKLASLACFNKIYW